MKILAEFSYEELFVLYELVSIDEMRRLLREENAYWVLPSGARFDVGALRRKLGELVDTKGKGKGGEES